MNIFVSTHPFSSTSELPMQIIKDNYLELSKNEYGRKITTAELVNDIKDAEVLIAGTEKVTEEVFKHAPNLKLITRVGIGLDGIDFELCKKYGVRVAYTPDAPTMAVAELCVAMMLDLARKVTETNNNLKNTGKWHRYMGMLLYGKTIGIMGMGRIGKSLVYLLSSFNVDFLVFDIKPDISYGRLKQVKFVSKEEVLKESDIISINVPLKLDTKDFISMKELNMMQNHAILINTARGGIVNEADLYIALKDKIISAAAVDVFEEEPYVGELTKLDNCILTCHMGASTIDSRTDMEVQAIEEAIRFKNGKTLKNEVFDNV